MSHKKIRTPAVVAPAPELPEICCGHCAWWVKDPAVLSGRVGKCKALPPTVVITRGRVASAWPKLTDTESCGCFKEMPPDDKDTDSGPT